MNKHQKGFAPIVIALIVLILAGVGGSGYYFWNKNNQEIKKNNSNQSQINYSNNQNNELDTQPKEKNEENQTLDIKQQSQVEIVESWPTIKMTDEQIKKFFHATEIINNNLPESIEFWTEANCSYYEDGAYNIPDYYSRDDYNNGSCIKGEKGTHGGCPACEMAKIRLIPWKIYTIKNFGFEFRHPLYIVRETKIYDCDGDSLMSACPTTVLLPNKNMGEVININGVNYCFFLRGDCAMNQCYDNHEYIITKNNKCLSFNFDLRSGGGCLELEGLDYKKCQENILQQEIKTRNNITSTFKIIN